MSFEKKKQLTNGGRVPVGFSALLDFAFSLHGAMRLEENGLQKLSVQVRESCDRMLCPFINTVSGYIRFFNVSLLIQPVASF